MAGKWCLEGFSVVENCSYPFSGEFDTEADALDAARLRLTQLEIDQPSKESGGQDEDGTQDHVYVIRPDSSRYRFVEFTLQE